MMTKRQTITRSVANARRAWQDHVQSVARAEGIPESYRTVLMYLLRHPGANQRNIAAFAGITTSAVNQTVKLMLEEDYLNKETDPTDKRHTRLYLTEKGEFIARRVFHRLDASDDAITARLGPEKEAALIALLDDLADFIRKDLT